MLQKQTLVKSNFSQKLVLRSVILDTTVLPSTKKNRVTHLLYTVISDSRIAERNGWAGATDDESDSKTRTDHQVSFIDIAKTIKRVAHLTANLTPLKGERPSELLCRHHCRCYVVITVIMHTGALFTSERGSAAWTLIISLVWVVGNLRLSFLCEVDDLSKCTIRSSVRNHGCDVLPPLMTRYPLFQQNVVSKMIVHATFLAMLQVVFFQGIPHWDVYDFTAMKCQKSDTNLKSFSTTSRKLSWFGTILVLVFLCQIYSHWVVCFFQRKGRRNSKAKRATERSQSKIWTSCSRIKNTNGKKYQQDVWWHEEANGNRWRRFIQVQANEGETEQRVEETTGRRATKARTTGGKKKFLCRKFFWVTAPPG